MGKKHQILKIYKIAHKPLIRDKSRRGKAIAIGRLQPTVGLLLSTRFVIVGPPEMTSQDDDGDDTLRSRLMLCRFAIPRDDDVMH